MLDLSAVLKQSIEKQASDIHLTENSPPVLRIDGQLMTLENYEVLTKEELKKCIYGILTDIQKEKFEKDLLGQADLPVTIASCILAAGISVATFWYPLAIYFGLLLVRTGLKTYCEI